MCAIPVHAQNMCMRVCVCVCVCACVCAGDWQCVCLNVCACTCVCVCVSTMRGTAVRVLHASTPEPTLCSHFFNTKHRLGGSVLVAASQRQCLNDSVAA